MLDNNTASKLREMKLGVMASSFSKQLKDIGISELSFEERFGLLVDAEWTTRKNNRLKRLMRNADYAFPGTCVEDIEYHADRQLDKAMIQRLAACNYVNERHNLIILGATGRERPTWPTHSALRQAATSTPSVISGSRICLANWPSPALRAITAKL